MATVKEMLNRLQSLDLHRIVKPLIGKNKDLMLDLNRDQMVHGRRSDGSAIQPEYTYFTRLSKLRKGMNPDVVTLYDTGGFYRKMFLDVGADEIEIDSTDPKSEDLKDKYGEHIFGLTPGSREQYIEDVFPEFKEQIEQSLKLQMK